MHDDDRAEALFENKSEEDRMLLERMLFEPYPQNFRAAILYLETPRPNWELRTLMHERYGASIARRAWKRLCDRGPTHGDLLRILEYYARSGYQEQLPRLFARIWERYCVDASNQDLRLAIVFVPPVRAEALQRLESLPRLSLKDAECVAMFEEMDPRQRTRYTEPLDNLDKWLDDEVPSIYPANAVRAAGEGGAVAVTAQAAPNVSPPEAPTPPVARPAGVGPVGTVEVSAPPTGQLEAPGLDGAISGAAMAPLAAPEASVAPPAGAGPGLPSSTPDPPSSPGTVLPVIQPEKEPAATNAGIHSAAPPPHPSEPMGGERTGSGVEAHSVLPKVTPAAIIPQPVSVPPAPAGAPRSAPPVSSSPEPADDLDDWG